MGPHAFARIPGSLWAKLWLQLPLVLAVSGCGDPSEPPLKTGSPNWKPAGIAGSVEIRPLPQSSIVVSNYKAWRASDVARKARVYEASLTASNQVDFAVAVSGGDTPMGYVESTHVSFIYRNPTNGAYELFWSRRGHHDAEFFRIRQGQKIVWLQPNGLTNRFGYPELKIVAFEGLEPDWGIYAEPGGNTPY